MNNTLIKSTAAALLIISAGTVQAESNTSGDYTSGSSSQSQSQQRGSDDSNRSSGSMQSGSGMQGDHDSMHSGAQSHMQLTGDADKDFAMRMKMHHQQGVEMAQVQLREGKSPKMKSMAKKMIATQKKEIEQFDKWLQSQQ